MNFSDFLLPPVHCNTSRFASISFNARDADAALVALDELPASNTAWANVKAAIANKAEVALYYSVDRNQSSSSLPTLQDETVHKRLPRARFLSDVAGTNLITGNAGTGAITLVTGTFAAKETIVIGNIDSGIRQLPTPSRTSSVVLTT